MPTTFVQNTQITPQTSHKDVPYLLGTLAQDDSIVFTKATLVAFLKTQGVEVGPNFSEFSRLPRYATFGTLVESKEVPAQPAAALATTSAVGGFASADSQSAQSPPAAAEFEPNRGVRDAEGQAFRPTRRVREPIGGGSAQIASLFGSEEAAPAPAPAPFPTHASAASPPLNSRSSNNDSQAPASQFHSSRTSSSSFTASKNVTDAEGNAFRPTRRVREAIGGGSEQIAGLFGGGDENDDYQERRRRTSHSPAASSSSQLPQAPLVSTPQSPRRGLFIALEGLDRAGKSTQIARLHDQLGGPSRTTLLKFPDRTTPIGKLLHSYLTSPQEQLDDRAVHLLFAANRWEVAARIRREVEQEGRIVLADRYAWSGVAYSRAKGLPLSWLFSPELGLPLPDLTLFLSLDPAVAAQRGGYGEERYEESGMQRRVRESFGEVARVVSGSGANWRELDAGRGGVEEVWEMVWGSVRVVVDGERMQALNEIDVRV